MASAEGLFVKNCERGIEADRQCQPVRRKPPFVDRHPQQQQPGNNYAGLRISSQDVLALLSRSGPEKFLEPRQIFVRSGHAMYRRLPVECTSYVGLVTKKVGC
jgi:hypothetical protein